MLPPAERIRRLLVHTTPALCVECVARVTRLSVDTVREVTTDLVAADVLTEGIRGCPMCESHGSVFQAKGGILGP